MKGRKCSGLLLLFSIIFGLSLSVSFSVNAVSGKQDVWSAYNDYLYIWSNSGPIRWSNDDFGHTISNENRINGITWTTHLSGPTYGNYTTGYYEYTIVMNVYGNTSPFSVNAESATCEVWSDDANPQRITSNAHLTKTYKKETLNSYVSTWGADYRCEFEASNLKPSYVFNLVGNATTSDSVMPAFNSYRAEFPCSSSQPCDILSHVKVQNVSFTYNTSNEGVEESQLSDLINGQKNIYNQIEEINNRDEQDRDNLTSQQSDASADASSSQSSAQSTGTTLLAAFSSFITAITNASPTNCNIDMDLGNLDLGIVNLCQLSPPPVFQTISSIFLIFFCVPLSIATARKVISLFRSFQS